MAMSVPTLAALMKAKCVAKEGSGVSADANPAFFEALAEAVIEHLTANAVVTPGTFAAGGDPVTGAGGLT